MTRHTGKELADERDEPEGLARAEHGLDRDEEDGISWTGSSRTL